MAESETRPPSPPEAQREPAAEHSDQMQSNGMKSSDALAEKSSTTQNDENEDKYPPFTTVVLIMLSLYLAIFLVALVGTVCTLPNVW